VTLTVLEELKADPEVYDKTGRTVKEMPDRANQMKEIAKQSEISEREKILGEDYKPLERDVALEHIRFIEMAKVGQTAGAAIAMRMGRLPQNQMPLMQEMAKIEAVDKLFLEKGVSEHDIILAFQKYDLLESEEFKQIM